MTILRLCYFFFSSRRRHTIWTGDWSSDVCSSDLFALVSDTEMFAPETPSLCVGLRGMCYTELEADRKSVVYGKSVDLGGRRIIKKKKNKRKGDGRGEEENNR